MTAALLRDYERKRRRAVEHFNALRAAVDRFANRDREPVRGELGPAGLRIFRVPLEPLDPTWAVVLGDFVYNTRASLDYLVTALIRSAGGAEHPHSQFPIHGINRRPWQEIDKWWEEDPDGAIARNLRGTPIATKAIIKRFQPFYGVPRVDPARHPLLALQVLSNRDKHRRLNLLAHRAALSFVDSRGRALFAGPTPTTHVAVTDEDDGYTVSLALGRDRDTDVYVRPSYEVRLNEAPEVLGDLIETLAGINELIDTQVHPALLGLMR